NCVFITAEGKIAPCCFLPHVYIGDALEEGVKKSIYSKTYIDFVENMNGHPVCGRCRW
ncbi:MAG: SPASM domain-containing protein, partial [Candidatus Omnitrophica bacterium]|nr:SPASM domain-containing protein [Candidatus Omnitrophota bacterium]